MRGALPGLYWGLVGALFGTGFIAIFSIGIFLLALGLILLVVGLLVRRLRRNLWAAIVGFGFIPALIFAYDIATAPPPCPSTTILVRSPVVCSHLSSSYAPLGVASASIALVGVGVGVVVRILAARRQGAVA